MGSLLEFALWLAYSGKSKVDENAQVEWEDIGMDAIEIAGNWV